MEVPLRRTFERETKNEEIDIPEIPTLSLSDSTCSDNPVDAKRNSTICDIKLFNNRLRKESSLPRILTLNEESSSKRRTKTSYLRGKQYSVPLDESEEIQILDELIANTRDDSIHMEKRSSCGYSVCISLDNISVALIVIMGIAIGILTIHQDNNSDPLIYTASAMGFCISGLQSLSSFYGFKERGLTHKRGSAACKKVRRDARLIEADKNMSDSHKVDLLMELLSTLDEVDLENSRASPPGIGTSKNLSTRTIPDTPVDGRDPGTKAEATINSVHDEV